MATLTTAIELILTDGVYTLNDQLIDSQRRAGLRASGRSAQSNSVVTEASGTRVRVQLRGVAYWEYQENGRRRGRGRIPKRLVEAIRVWALIKGVNIPVYAIAGKIHYKGIQVPNRHNPGKVVSSVLNAENARKAVGVRLRDAVFKELKSELYGLLT